MYDLTTDASTLDWSPTGWAGVTMKLLNRGVDGNSGGGGTTGLMRLAAGSVIPAHRHTTADQSVYILEGDLMDEGVTYGAGTLIVAKAGTPHGPHATKGGCVLLSIYHGTPDFVMVEKT